MKRISVVLIVPVFFSSLCFAQLDPTPAGQVDSSASENQTFAGKVFAVSRGGFMGSSGGFGKKAIKRENKKEKSKKKHSETIIVMDEKGDKQSFKVGMDCPVTIKNGKAYNLKGVREGDTIRVTYAPKVKKGTSQALAIEILASKGMLSRLKDMMFSGPMR